MTRQTFLRRTPMPASAEALFAWHARPGAFERLSPPWQRVELLDRGRGVAEGSRSVLRLCLGPVGRRWVAEHRDVVPGRGFRDVQVRGPFAQWVHAHRFEPAGEDRSVLEDAVEYVLPLGWVGAVAGARFARRTLERLFAFRHAVTRGDLAAHARDPAGRPRRLLVVGGERLLAPILVPYLRSGGHRVLRLQRGGVPPGEVAVDLDRPPTLDAVIHLEGPEVLPFARRRHGRERALRRASRLASLARTFARSPRPPRTLVVLSQAGGDAEAVRTWEEAALVAEAAGVRVVLLRPGLVLTPEGGPVRRLVTLFSMGLGGTVGPPDTPLPWIGREDVPDTVLHALVEGEVRGAIDLVGPQPATHADLARALGEVLGRPAAFRHGPWATRRLLGPAAVAWRVPGDGDPGPLGALGYRWRHPTLEAALRHGLGRREAEAAGRDDPWARR